MASAIVDAGLLPALGGGAAAIAERLKDSLVAVRSRAGGGSGTIWSRDGLIVTNSHVVPGEKAEVLTRDDRRFEAALVARDELRDLAALRIDAPGLDAVEVGDSTALRVGEIVLAVGNPWGRRGVVSAGIVMSIGEATEENRVPLYEAIRADVQLAPGSSGGPLADARGRVIGINTMIAGGMAVAVPSNVVARFVAAGGSLRGFLGIAGRAVPLPPVVAASAAVPDGSGLLVTEVVPGSPAEAAGLLQGDIVVGLDGPRGLASVAHRLRGIEAGERVRVAMLRGGALREVEAVAARWA
jgi:serine protease Do